jgi:hypothetical protein
VTIATSSDVEIATFSVTDAYMVDISSGNENGHFYLMYDYVGTASLYVSVSSPLDYESSTSHSLTIDAWDMEGNSVSGSLLVNVLDVVEAPTFTFTGPPGGFPVAEDASSGTLVGTLTADDPQNDIYMYSISGGDPNGDFSIDSTGQITVQGTLDFETTPSYTLTVDVMDMGGNSASANVTITVTDMAEAPTFTFTGPPDGFPVAEDASSGTLVGTLTATDPQNDIYMYSISGGDPNGDFSIDSTGQITVQGTLDFETTPSYTLTVDVMDMGGNSASANVTITVTDMAEATTGWTIASPSDSTTVEVTEFEPVVISGPRGTNPEGKVITLDIWWLGDEDAEEPYATFVLDDGTGSVSSGDWSVSVLLPSGEFFAEVLWDGIVVPMINNPRSVTFIVNRQIGDPIP